MSLEHITAMSSLTTFVRASDLWDQLVAFDTFASIVPEVDKVTLLHDNKSEWFITVEGTPFAWIEIDNKVLDEYTLKFHCISGDFEYLSGFWKIFRDYSAQNQILFDLNYSSGIPVIEGRVDNIFREKMQKYAQSMVVSHTKKIIDQSKDTRALLRYSIEKNREITIDNKTYDVYIKNISCAGLMFLINKGSWCGKPDNCKVKLDTESFENEGILYFDKFTQTCRIVFSRKLSDELVLSVVDIWSKQSGGELIKVFEVLTSETVYSPDHIVANH